MEGALFQFHSVLFHPTERNTSLAITVSILERMHALVSARGIIIELVKRKKYKLKNESHVSKSWEDNIGTHNLENSKVPLMASSKKYLGIK